MLWFVRYFWFLVVGGVLLVGGFGAGVYGYCEPHSWVGYVYCRLIYSPWEEDLVGLRDHLREVEGGYLDARMDGFLFGRLGEVDRGSQEFGNILGFYAGQAGSSRAGVRMFEDGEGYLGAICDAGRAAVGVEEKLGYLYLGYGVARGRALYKPGYGGRVEDLDACFDLLEAGDFKKVRVVEL